MIERTGGLQIKGSEMEEAAFLQAAPHHPVLEADYLDLELVLIQFPFQTQKAL